MKKIIYLAVIILFINTVSATDYYVSITESFGVGSGDYNIPPPIIPNETEEGNTTKKQKTMLNFFDTISITQSVTVKQNIALTDDLTTQDNYKPPKPPFNYTPWIVTFIILVSVGGVAYSGWYVYQIYHYY